MILALALAVLATTSPTQGYSSAIKNNQITVRFYDLSKIYGPFKFYVNATATPQAAPSCASCPSGGAEASYVVSPTSVVQKWASNGRYVDVTFPASAMGDLQYFYFTAVTCVPDAERYLGSGVVPSTRIL